MTEDWRIVYFKEMRAEINLRIKNHTTLVTSKVVTAGGVLAFLLTKNVADLPVVNTLGFVVVPIVAFLFDIMIAKNVRNIHKIGTFIRDQIETQLQGAMWETYAGQQSRWTRCYGIFDVVVLSFFTLGTIVITLFVLKEKQPDWILPAGIGLISMFVVVVVYMVIAVLGFDPIPSSTTGKVETAISGQAEVTQEDNDLV